MTNLIIYILYATALSTLILVLIPMAIIKWIDLCRQITNPEDE